MFELNVIWDKSNAFCNQLACIAVDEVHLIWCWKELCKKFSNIGIFQLIFPKIPIMAISVTITPNILKYVRKTTNLKTAVRLYWRSLDYVNIIYTVVPITNSSFQNLNFRILSKLSAIGNIEKTMIFVNSIEKSIALGLYLWTLLLENLKNREDDIIKSFLLVLKAKTKTDWLEAFLNGNTRIIICTDTKKMRVNIPDIKRVIQWTIIDHFILTTVF